MSPPLTDYAPDERLAVYGSLRPGAENAHVLAPLAGEWAAGTVRGRLHNSGWAAEGGYPGITLDDRAEAVEVALFCSHGLPSFWPTLDAFEGADYRRSEVEVDTPEGSVTAFIYELAAPRAAD